MVFVFKKKILLFIVLYNVFIRIHLANGFLLHSIGGRKELMTRHTTTVPVPRRTLRSSPLNKLSMRDFALLQSKEEALTDNSPLHSYSKRFVTSFSFRERRRGSNGKTTKLGPLHSSSYPMMEMRGKSQQHKATAVYALILASVISFVGDNILHLRFFRNMYLYHRNWRWWQPLTSTFCHGDQSHLSGNVFLLLLFGRSVEDELGTVGLIISYLFCGLVSNFVSLWLLPKHTVSIGASGAVFGLFSISIASRLVSWKDLLDWRKMIDVCVLGQFVVQQFLQEAKTVASGGIMGVNHVAHLSGAVAGVAMIWILKKLIHILERRTKA